MGYSTEFHSDSTRQAKMNQKYLFGLKQGAEQAQDPQLSAKQN